MKKEDFLKTLKKLDISKAQLSRDMGIAYSTVKSWYVNNKKMPLYVEKYLLLLLKVQKYNDIEKNIKDLTKSIEKL